MLRSYTYNFTASPFSSLITQQAFELVTELCCRTDGPRARGERLACDRSKTARGSDQQCEHSHTNSDATYGKRVQVRTWDWHNLTISSLLYFLTLGQAAPAQSAFSEMMSKAGALLGSSGAPSVRAALRPAQRLCRLHSEATQSLLPRSSSSFLPWPQLSSRYPATLNRPRYAPVFAAIMNCAKR